jgi:hypothetical protein
MRIGNLFVIRLRAVKTSYCLHFLVYHFSWLTWPKTAQLQPVRGFDRLVSVGFSETDIANFRRQFHSQSSSNYLDTDFDTEEECEFF